MSSQSVFPPDLEQALSQRQNQTFATMNCIQVGRIDSFNATNQTANVQIQVQRRVNNQGQVADYPLLQDCPVVVLQGGGAYIDLPIAEGDYCLVLFNDRNIDTWWDTGNVVVPRNRRKHSLSDGIALVGINPRIEVREIDGTAVRILGTSGPGSEEFAARQNDAIQSTSTEDAIFWTWVAAVSAAAGVPSPPTSLTGRISGGSTEVKIG